MTSKRKITRELRELGLLGADEILRELFAHGGPMRAASSPRRERKPARLTCADCGRALPPEAPYCNCGD